MVRSLALIVLATQLSRPTIPRQEAVHYAKVLQQEAKEHDFDPFTGVAIIHYESYWHPGVVSKDGEDYGLAQIRARYVKGCRDDEDPLGAPSPRCQAAKARLLDGATNIRRMAALITANRELCKEKRGRVWFHEWLASYQGRNRPKQDKWCTPGDGTWRVVNYRKELIAKLIPRPPRAKAATASKRLSKSEGKARKRAQKQASKSDRSKPADKSKRANKSDKAKQASKSDKSKRANKSEKSKQADAKPGKRSSKTGDSKRRASREKHRG